MVSVSMIDLMAGKPFPGKPFELDALLYDIPSQVIAALEALPDNCEKVRVLDGFSFEQKNRIEEAATEKGIAIEWVPYSSNISWR